MEETLPDFQNLLADLASNHISLPICEYQPKQEENEPGSLGGGKIVLPYASRSLIEEVQQTKELFLDSKRRYLEVSTIYEELFDLLFYDEESESPPEDLREQFVACQATDLLQLTPKTNLLGLTPRDILHEPTTTTNSQSSSFQRSLTLNLEKRFLRRVDHIFDHFRNLLQAAEHDEVLTKSGEPLWKIILHEHNSLQSLEKGISEMSSLAISGLLDHSKILVQSLGVACQILLVFKFEFQLSFDTSLCDSLEKRCQTMSRKLELLKQSFLRETYSPDCVLALTNIRSIFKEKLSNRKRIQAVITDANKLNKSLQMRLEEYDKVGLGFSELLQEYSNLLVQLEDKKWALEQL